MKKKIKECKHLFESLAKGGKKSGIAICRRCGLVQFIGNKKWKEIEKENEKQISEINKK